MFIFSGSDVHLTFAVLLGRVVVKLLPTVASNVILEVDPTVKVE